MNFSNYGYRSPSSRPPSTYPSQFASTPTNSRFLIPRFGYSSIPSYPRPRSSASKPNPDSYSEDTDSPMDGTRSMYEYPDDLEPTRSLYENNNSNMDSMRNNFGSPDVNMGNSYPSRDNSYANHDSFQSPNSSAYYSCNNSFSQPTNLTPQAPTPSFSPQAPTLSYSPQAPTPSFLPQASTPSFSSEFSLFKNQNSVFGSNNSNPGHFQNKSKYNFKHNSTGQAKAYFPKKINPVKKKMATKTEWRCSLCSIDFTSSIPFEMHLRGARHAKKLKTQDVYQSIKKQVADSKDIASVGNTFRCDLCNVQANSSLQFQTHLDGTKHKNKVAQLNQAKEKKVEEKTESEASQVNGKSNGSTVRSLPSEFGEPQPTKLSKFSCDICNVIVNSETQLQQHLTSKKHQAKVEGKPLQKKKVQKKEETKETTEGDSSEAPMPLQEEPKTVVGVKTLSSSFVAGETLQ